MTPEKEIEIMKWLVDNYPTYETNCVKVWELIKIINHYHESEVKTSNMSDVISRFSFRDGDEETENKIIRYVELRGMLRTNTMGFVNSKEFQDNYFEMEELRRWIGQI